jgi:hypothetical protein
MEIARGECEGQPIEMSNLGRVLMPWKWYLIRINTESTRLLAEVYAEVKERVATTHKFYQCKTKSQYRLEDALDLY